MVLLSISFENMHQILRNLYDTMTKLCHPMMDMAMALLPCLAVSLPCGAHRCLFDVTAFCPGHVYPFL
mgnify:CR=1 FL=1